MKLTPVYNIHPGGDVISDYVPQSGGISHPLAVRAGYGGRVSPLRGRPENQSGLTLRGVGGAEGEGGGLRRGRGLSCIGAASNNTSNKREERGEPRDREKARDRYYGENN